MRLVAQQGFTLTVTATGSAPAQNFSSGAAISNVVPGTYAVTLARHRIFGCPAGVVNAVQSWWGCSADPGGSETGGPCDTATVSVTTSPRIGLSATSLTSAVPGTKTACAPTPVGFVAAAIPTLSDLGTALLGLALCAAALAAMRFLR